MCCPKLYAVFSESGKRQLQGVIRKEWPVLVKDDNVADGGFPARPKGSPKIPQYSVAALDKGITIACKLRLVLRNFGASEIYIQFRTVH